MTINLIIGLCSIIFGLLVALFTHGQAKDWIARHRAEWHLGTALSLLIGLEGAVLVAQNL